ncbi:hypothetical protein BleG1_2855 [Shouchella lehensis G1]|uniref:Uncharacterized protein n=1 Tax=Shouchella lehensis G1 TaxID=1246626 RepID=A0A060M5Q8_9BACI|nr:hypothetical protein BleG1_2855 [Shouchella lehensis G1]
MKKFKALATCSIFALGVILMSSGVTTDEAGPTNPIGTDKQSQQLQSPKGPTKPIGTD